MQVLAGPEGLGFADLEAAAAQVERHRVGDVGLQLDGVGPQGFTPTDGTQALVRQLDPEVATWELSAKW